MPQTDILDPMFESITKSAMTLSQADLKALQAAKNILENPGLAAQLTSVVGTPIQAGLKRLPAKIHQRLGTVLEAVLLKVARTATVTMAEDFDDRPRGTSHGEAGREPRGEPRGKPHNRLHTLGVVVSGGVGGFFGPWAMLAEIPVTTGIIFRSIADIARSEGESIKSEATILACVEVFAFGGKTEGDDAAESGYYMVRAALAQQAKTASDFLAKSASDRAAPHLVALIKKVVERLGVQYTEKLGAQLVPVIGAVGGAAINTIFISHFQAMAKGHFTVLRLERKYTKEIVETAYKLLPKRG
ncbi:EcsC family protein [Burkholderia sp. L27(2015)]|uniref:EcsC family protein n=1 Tax=Burkholderia sp. L27(2015) TaxID=1641858 RepID=UPI001C208B75|nr:EcsC family protein [Burkholderia sp. L27(2015)]